MSPQLRRRLAVVHLWASLVGGALCTWLLAADVFQTSDVRVEQDETG